MAAHNGRTAVVELLLQYHADTELRAQVQEEPVMVCLLQVLQSPSISEAQYQECKIHTFVGFTQPLILLLNVCSTKTLEFHHRMLMKWYKCLTGTFEQFQR